MLEEHLCERARWNSSAGCASTFVADADPTWPAGRPTPPLPYAFVCSLASIVGYLTLGVTKSVAGGLLATVAALAEAVAALRMKFPSETPRSTERETAAV